MADLMQFSVTRNGTVSLPNAPTWRISGKIVDSATQQTVLADFTGANVVNFPQVLGQLTNAQQDRLVEMIVRQILEFKFGI
jgi:hypothetical protein